MNFLEKQLFTLLFIIFAVPNAWALESDSISKNVADLDSLIQMVETNYAGFPIIMQKGYSNDYQMMKADVIKQVSAGKVGIQQAVCEYCYWFFSIFDGHVYVDHPLFFEKLFPKMPHPLCRIV